LGCSGELYIMTKLKPCQKAVKTTVGILRRYKESKGCARCGYNKSGLALDFAHKDPSTKSEHIIKRGPCGSGMGKMVARLTFGKNGKLNEERKKDLWEEIEKCEVLCKNCHVIETFDNREMHNSMKTSRERQLIANPVANLEKFFQ